MKKLLTIGLLGFAAYHGWERFQQAQGVEPLYDQPYVAVYGRDNCGFTKKTLRELKSSGVNYKYFSVDNASVTEQLTPRMRQSGLSTKRYYLPVVDVNGHISIRPERDTILAKYNL